MRGGAARGLPRSKFCNTELVVLVRLKCLVFAVIGSASAEVCGAGKTGHQECRLKPWIVIADKSVIELSDFAESVQTQCGCPGPTAVIRRSQAPFAQHGCLMRRRSSASDSVGAREQHVHPRMLARPAGQRGHVNTERRIRPRQKRIDERAAESNCQVLSGPWNVGKGQDQFLPVDLYKRAGQVSDHGGAVS